MVRQLLPQLHGTFLVCRLLVLGLLGVLAEWTDAVYKLVQNSIRHTRHTTDDLRGAIVSIHLMRV